MNISRKTWNTYLAVKRLGICKPKDIETIVAIAQTKFFTKLTEEQVGFIQAHFSILKHTYEEDD